MLKNGYAGTSVLAMAPTHSAESMREIEIMVESEDGRQLILKDKAFLGPVQQPLIAYGKLLAANWGIDPDGPSLVHKQAGARVPIFYKNKSLCMEGSVRHVQVIRHVEAVLEEPLRGLPQGWILSTTGNYVCRNIGNRFVNPTDFFLSGMIGTEQHLRITTVLGG